MTSQRLILDGGYPDGLWSCAGCKAVLTEGVLEHPGDCAEMARVCADERERLVQLARKRLGSSIATLLANLEIT